MGNPELIGQSVAQTPGLILKRYPERFGLHSLSPCRTLVRPSCLTLVCFCSRVKPLHFTHSNSTLASINNHLQHTGPTHCATAAFFVKIEIAHKTTAESELSIRTKKLKEEHLCLTGRWSRTPEKESPERLVTVRALLRKTLSASSVHVRRSCTGCN